MAYILLIAVLIVILFVNISLGSVSIPAKAIFKILTGDESVKESWRYILLNYRIPKAFTAILVGSSLSVCGLLMQTLFRNPLAGPFVLGISSGASLGVAILILGSSLLFGSTTYLSGTVSTVIAAALGSFLVLLGIVAVAIRIRDTMAILIIGLMFGSLSAAIVSVLSYFSNSEKLQQYIFWTFGSLGDLSWKDLLIFGILCLVGILLSLYLIKSLNALLLGENYAKSMGLNIKRSRFMIIIATSILAATVTAYAGPIAFIGLAVPHLTRQIFNTTNHKILLPAIILYGAILMLICDTIAQLPSSEFTLPINAITTVVGAPVVIWLLVKRKKMLF